MNPNFFDFSMENRSLPINPHWIDKDDDRKNCKLITIDKKSNSIEKSSFSKIIDYIQPGDVVVLNNSRILANAMILKNETHVIKFILHGFTPDGIVVTPFFADICCNSSYTLCDFPHVSIEIKEKNSDSSWNASISDPQALVKYLSSNGERFDEYVSSRYFYTNRNAYEAVFATEYGSLDIPSAGIHFTNDIIDKIKNKGAIVKFITLHVSTSEMALNRIVNTDNIEDFKINPEYYDVPQETADCINEAVKRGSRIFAIGTTVTRALESAFDHSSNKVVESKGWTTLYINPSYKIRVVDCLLTNLHQPKSSHMVLTAQFAGADLLMQTYKSKEMDSMNFDLFGDCMLVLK
ncbi:S-adenosylmethionine:tRNA ribosyltransferase-isomerase [Brucella sp. 2594]|uniref:S-adenosylmethionine:tRNA ribosyltransferase-isomerase n=1 Tax=Brucella sp. 2594 TaxID=2975051 RepID=UPI00217F0069|nr:S-adenosylmethionine:tRNA ribosyltransferase-isomerase [Brucella sp. 2594]UWF70312.1 S-adenosylmethionine:tRNA ribosyltransferase-isomerase [Brucella sp. 2594]